MGFIETIWSLRKPFQMSGLEFWGSVDNTDDPANLYDQSINGRDMTVVSNEPELQQNIINGIQSLYFDGTNNPLKFTDNFQFKHAFLVVAMEDEEFDGDQGILSALTTNGLLTGVDGEAVFEDFGYTTNFVYGKNYVDFANDNLEAPMNGRFAIIEIVCPAGLSLDGLQIGQHLADAGTKGKFWFNELIVFSVVKSYYTRQDIYHYFAEKYHLWKELADGTRIFPFSNNHQSPYAPVRYRIQSPPLPNGKFKMRIKGSKLQQYDFNFTNRRQGEALAVDKFETENFGSQFVVEHNSFYPPRRSNVYAVSDIEVSPRSVNLFDYRFTGRQVEVSQVLVEPTLLYLVQDGYFITIDGNFITVAGG
jgi:hypothetical protein